MHLTTGQDKYTYHNEVNNFLRSEKVCCMSLTFHNVPAYPLVVAAKSATGRGNPSKLVATPDALTNCVFFCVDASVPSLLAVLICFESMVTLAGQLSSWPVSISTGISTPVSVTTQYERGNSGGDSYLKLMELIIMMANHPQTRPYFTWLFLAFRRSDVHSKPHRCEVTAPDYLSARQIISRDHIASFAGRMPVRKA